MRETAALADKSEIVEAKKEIPEIQDRLASS